MSRGSAPSFSATARTSFSRTCRAAWSAAFPFMNVPRDE
jgi:hypothetical protein